MNSFTESVGNHEILELLEYEALDTSNLDTYSQPQTNSLDINETTGVNTQNVEGMNLVQFGSNFPKLNVCPNLYEGLLFPNFDIAHHYCLEFGRFSGFAVRKKRVEKNSDGSIRSRCMDCEFSGKIPNDSSRVNIRNKGSKKTECPWHINLSQPLNSNFVKITKFVNEHNHELIEDNVIFGTEFRELSDEIKENIQYFVSCGVTDLPTIRNLLKGKFSDQFILSQDLLNYIQKLKREFGNNNDASSLLNDLFTKQKEDPLYLVIPRVDSDFRLSAIFWMSPDQQMLFTRYNDVVLHDNTALTNHYKWPLSLFIIVDCDNKTRLVAQAFVQDETLDTYIWLLQCLKRTNIEPNVILTDADPAMIGAIQLELPNTYHLHCIFHIHQNLPRKLKGILGKDYLPFVKDFYIARNALSEEMFELYWERLRSRYQQIDGYLQNTLYKSKESWALYFTLKLFTGGMQSTQRVEGLNGILHKSIDPKMSLSSAYQKLVDRLNTENMTRRFLTFKYAKTNYSQPLTLSTIFTKVNSQLSYWLSPSICAEHQKQICEIVTYRARIIELTEILMEQLDYNEIANDHSSNELIEEDDDDEKFAEFVEDKYEDRKIYIRCLLNEINITNVIQIWEVTSLISKSKKSCQFVLLLRNGMHACTCMLLVNYGVICRHYFKVMLECGNARFHITMIPRRWFKEELQLQEEQIKNAPILTAGGEILNLSDTFQIENDDLAQIQPLFNQYYQPPTTQRQAIKKSKYAMLTGLSRDATKLALEDGDNELKILLTNYIKKRKAEREEKENRKRLNAIENTIDIEDNDHKEGQVLFESEDRVYATDQIKNPLEHVAKGRPTSTRLKSSLEIQKKRGGNIGKENLAQNDKVNKKEYVCGKCKEVGHNARTCKN